MNAPTTPELNERFRAMEPAGAFLMTHEADEVAIDWTKVDGLLEGMTFDAPVYGDDLPFRPDRPSEEDSLVRARSAATWGDDYETAYGLAEPLYDLYGCDGLKRTRLNEALAEAIWLGRQAARKQALLDVIEPASVPLLALCAAAGLVALGAFAAFLGQALLTL